MATPIHSIRFIHKAVRTELASIEEAAAVLATGGDDQVAHLAERVGFLHAVLKGHSGGEEEAFYPALEQRVPHAAESYVLEHQAKERAFEHIGSLLAQLQQGKGGPERAELARRVGRECIGLNATMTLHILQEEEQLVPLFDSVFSPPEQGPIVGQMIGHMPQELMPKAVPWVLNALSPEEQEALIRSVQRGSPPEGLRSFVTWAKDGLRPEQWDTLAGRMPDLEAMLQ